MSKEEKYIYLLATHFVDNLTRPDFAILFYPVITMDAALTHSGSRKCLLGETPLPDLVHLYSNETQVSSLTPPTLLFHSSDDKSVSSLNSTLFYEALKRNNVSATMHIFPTGGHGWGMNDTFTYQATWKELLRNWLIDLDI